MKNFIKKIFTSTVEVPHFVLWGLLVQILLVSVGAIILGKEAMEKSLMVLMYQTELSRCENNKHEITEFTKINDCSTCATEEKTSLQIHLPEGECKGLIVGSLSPDNINRLITHLYNQYLSSDQKCAELTCSNIYLNGKSE